MARVPIFSTVLKEAFQSDEISGLQSLTASRTIKKFLGREGFEYVGSLSKLKKVVNQPKYYSPQVPRVLEHAASKQVMAQTFPMEGGGIVFIKESVLNPFEGLGSFPRRPDYLKKSLQFHEATEAYLSKRVNSQNLISSHAHPGIYISDFEFSTIFGDKTAKRWIAGQIRDIYGLNPLKDKKSIYQIGSGPVIADVLGRSKTNLVREHVRSLPKVYKTILRGKGYSEKRIKNIVGELDQVTKIHFPDEHHLDIPTSVTQSSLISFPSTRSKPSLFGRIKGFFKNLLPGSKKVDPFQLPQKDFNKPPDFPTSFGAPPVPGFEYSRSSQLKSRHTFGKIAQSILEKGKATEAELASGRITRKRMGQIIKEYGNSKGITFFGSKNEIAKHLAAKGLSSREIGDLVSKVTKSFGSYSGDIPQLKNAIYVASSSELKARGFQRRVPEARLLIGLHEATEAESALSGLPKRKILGHSNPAIYRAELELLSSIDKEAIKRVLPQRLKELPRAIDTISKWKDASQAKEALDEIYSLPKHFRSILQTKGYSPADIEDLVTPLSKTITRGRKIPTGPLVEGYNKALKQVRGKFSLEEIPNPTKRVEKLAAQKVVQKEVVKAVQKTKELVRPAKMVDQVSSGVNKMRRVSKLSSLKGLLPVAVGGAIVADVLASKDKTPTFWGAVTGAVSYIASGVKFKGLARAGFGIAGYIAGRLVTSALDGNHEGTGFGESGEAAINRKQLTDFGSGYKTMGKAATVLEKKVVGVAKQALKKLQSFGTLAEDLNLVRRNPSMKLVDQWHDILSRNNAIGARQQVLIENQIKEGIYEKLLPTVKQDPLEFTGKTITRKFNLPASRLGITRKNADQAILDYAKEKGISYSLPKRESLPLSKIEEIKQVSKSQDYRKVIESADTIDHRDLLEIWKGPNKNLANLENNPTVLETAEIGHMKTMSGEALANTIQDIGQLKTLSDVGRLDTLHQVRSIKSVQMMRQQENLKTLLDVGEMSTIALNPLDLGQAKTISNIGEAKTISNIGEASTLINNIPESGIPVPLARTISPSLLEGHKIQSASGRTKIGSSATRIGQALNKHSSWMSETVQQDMANAQSDGALYRRGHPRVLEGFRDNGVTSQRRKGFTDFGSGKDAARGLLRALNILKKVTPEAAMAAKKTVPQATREAFETAIKSDVFQEALQRGRKVKTLGSGGVGTVDLMEVEIQGQKFKYARKSYHESPSASADELLEQERKGLEALQHSIGPTPYGRGKVVGDTGEELDVMFMEYVQGGQEASDYAIKHGGLKKSQVKKVWDSLSELHKRNLSHGDLKLENMMIDKDGDIFLIDPMPDRLKISGMKGLASEKDMQTFQRSMDHIGIERIAEGGNPEDIARDLHLISNVPAAAALRQYSPWRSEIIKEFDPFIKAVYKRSKTPSIEKGFDTLFQKTDRAVKEREIIQEAREEMRILMEKRAKPQKAQDVVSTRNYKVGNAVRENLHKQAVEQMVSNNMNPSRRHRGS